MVGWGIGGGQASPGPPKSYSHFCCLSFVSVVSFLVFWLPRPPQASPGLTRPPQVSSARAPPWFSHTESDWSARSLGRHRVFLTTRTLGAPVRSGATMFFTHREQLERPLARAPPCFSHHENAWSARPLGRHRGFRTLRATGLRARSGATVFFTHRVRLERRPRLGPENLICKT